MALLRRYTILVVLLIGALACSLGGTVATPTAIPPAIPTMQPSDTPAAKATATVEETHAPAASATAAVTDTPNPLAGTGLEGFSKLQGVANYFNPVGQPVTDWKGIPIMSQATAGQEWESGQIYSFKAPGGIADAVAFYESKMPPLGYSPFMAGPATGSAGSGASATHDSMLMYAKAGQMTIIYIASYDNDPAHFIVVISAQ